MYSSNNLPWTKINDFLLEVGNVREPKAFCAQVIIKVYPLIPYDQARIYFVNDYGKVYDNVLMGVEKRWSDIYLEYFSKIENGRYAIPTRRYSLPERETGRLVIPKIEGGIYDWTHYACNQFVNEYIKPQGIKYSAGFGFHSADSFMKSVYSLDRTGRSGFTQEEIDIMCIIQTHLDNLHKNLFVLASKTRNKNSAVQNLLTRREAEIADLLCRGMTPIKISDRLCISLPTTYRHIANLHGKLNVSNRQELLLKLMDLQAAENKPE
jgi:DNA-binding CsgD family transcriptional regulator